MSAGVKIMELQPDLALAISNRDRSASRVEILAIADHDLERDIPLAVSQACEAAEQLRRLGVELFDADDGRSRLPSKNEWDAALLHKLMAGLDYNFSLERLRQVQEVIVYLRARSSVKGTKPHVKRDDVVSNVRRRMFVRLAIAVSIVVVGIIAVVLIRRF